MKLIVYFFIVLLPLCALAQKKRHELTPDSLAHQLVAPYTKEKDKVAAIFGWVADNISYNANPRYNSRWANNFDEDDADDTGALKPLSERVAIDVLRKRIAFCDGYSRLFKTLCDYAGIRCEVITGYAGVNSRSRYRFSSNHRWNAVYIDSTWQLLDVTWASGYISFSDEFIRHYNDYYFLTPAKEFARDHYPEELQWTLLSQPPYLSEFKNSPFKTNAYVKNKIRSFYPSSGIIEAKQGDTLTFVVETEDPEKKMFLVDNPIVDSADVAKMQTDSTQVAKCLVNGDTVTYKYVVTSPNVEWLNVVFNDEILLRYKVNILKNDTAVR